MMKVLVAELSDRRDHRTDRGVAERAEGLAADVVGHVEQKVGVLLTALSPLHAVENRLHPVRSLAARRALSARLVCEELREPPDRVDDADRFVEHDDAG